MSVQAEVIVVKGTTWQEMPVDFKIKVLWDVMLCSWVSISHCSK
jgi:hypothetical protein